MHLCSIVYNKPSKILLGMCKSLLIRDSTRRRGCRSWLGRNSIRIRGKPTSSKDIRSYLDSRQCKAWDSIGAICPRSIWHVVSHTFSWGGGSWYFHIHRSTSGPFWRPLSISSAWILRTTYRLRGTSFHCNSLYSRRSRTPSGRPFLIPIFELNRRGRPG